MIRFFVFADLHYDVAFCGRERFQKILDKIKGESFDFAISLGDLQL